MGWSFAYRDIGRKAHIEELTSQKHFAEGYTPLEHRVVGNHVWQLVRIESEGRTFITLDLIAKARGEGWGYKGMSEDSGPYYFDCPLSLLNKADPPASEYGAAWRQKVREYHASKAKRVKREPGQVVTYGQYQYRLLAPCHNTRKGWNVTRVSDGMNFRMSCKQINEAKVST
jgi:hypothetical protein